MAEELLFHLSGDDHEERVYRAEDEAQARELCAEGFNAQYDDADYDGSEFALLGVYRTIADTSFDVDDPDGIAEALRDHEIVRVH